jgi:hypothetical protein
MVINNKKAITLAIEITGIKFSASSPPPQLYASSHKKKKKQTKNPQ